MTLTRQPRLTEEGVRLRHHDIPLQMGLPYLAAILDIHSKQALSWTFSNSLDPKF